jgi:hypothetical protein
VKLGRGARSLGRRCAAPALQGTGPAARATGTAAAEARAKALDLGPAPGTKERWTDGVRQGRAGEREGDYAYDPRQNDRAGSRAEDRSGNRGRVARTARDPSFQRRDPRSRGRHVEAGPVRDDGLRMLLVG